MDALGGRGPVLAVILVGLLAEPIRSLGRQVRSCGTNGGRACHACRKGQEKRQQPCRIVGIDRIIQTIPIPVRITAPVPYGIGCGLPAGEGVVVPPAEADEPQIAVMQAAREADGHAQARIGVINDPAEGIVEDFLYHVAVRVGNHSQ